jgi:Zn-dependent M28 family amino/carboxypeptidase
VGPENKHTVYTFDAVNILAEFASPKSQEATKLMFIAHYDSRYSQPVPPRDTVWSYGAADDGYGIGVTLETLNLALKYRDKWQQGVKVLFTDAEEVGMMGMKAMWEQNREQFDDVGFVINLEARGPNGPALLFETSAGNERIMELYDQRALSPFTYSLTTVVYSFMPNFTDFTIIKDTLPGVNFSTIADINHYHTDLDNLDNINPKSIQHYGAQVVPMVEQYLCDPK